MIMDAKTHGTYYRKPKQRVILIGHKARKMELSVRDWVLDLHQETAKRYDRHRWWELSRALDANELVLKFPCYYPFSTIKDALAGKLEDGEIMVSDPIKLPKTRYK